MAHSIFLAVCFELLVGVRGFELPTSTSRTWRANQLRYTPNATVATHEVPTD